MFGKRAQKADERQMRQKAAEARHEIQLAHLQERVRRLEATVEQILTASPSEPQVTGPRAEAGKPDHAGTPPTPTDATGFAEAWSEEDNAISGVENSFFEDSQVDQRARRWLLTRR